MKKSELAKRLMEEVEKFGDDHIRTYKIVCRNETVIHNMASRTRKDAYGNKANMSQKEFEQYCLDNPICDQGK